MKRLLILLTLTTVYSVAFGQTKAQARAQRFVRHQHLVVQAIREILNDDPERYCKDLAAKDCTQAKADQAEMMRIIHQVADRDSGQGEFK